MDLYNTIQWKWMGMKGQHGKDPTHGYTKLKKARVGTTFRIGDAKVGNGGNASTFDLPEL